MKPSKKEEVKVNISFCIFNKVFFLQSLNPPRSLKSTEPACLSSSPRPSPACIAALRAAWRGTIAAWCFKSPPPIFPPPLYQLDSIPSRPTESPSRLSWSRAGTRSSEPLRRLQPHHLTSAVRCLAGRSIRFRPCSYRPFPPLLP